MWRVQEITAAELRARRGDAFTLGGVPVTLVEVREGALAGGGVLDATFDATAPHGLEQGTYPVGHAELATTELFAVPVSPTGLCVTFTWLDPQPPAGPGPGPA